MLSALNDAGAEFIVVGGYAMAAHGSPRATGDIDIWVRPTQENAERVMAALKAFRAPLNKVSAEDFTAPDIVYQIGLPPQRIDLVTSIDGVKFDDAWLQRIESQVDGIPINFLAKVDLLTNKETTGRPKDLADVDWLKNRRQLD